MLLGFCCKNRSFIPGGLLSIHGTILNFLEHCTTLTLALRMQQWPGRDGNNLVQMYCMLVNVKLMLLVILIYSLSGPKLESELELLPESELQLELEE